MGADVELDSADKRILDIIQGEFPLVPRPYAELGQKLGMAEDEVFRRVSAMRKRGLVRRLGANFQSAKIGFTSTLCAAKVPPAMLESFIALVNAIPGVTHNYERDHDYNIWFTLISPSSEDARAMLADLEAKTGISILNLPATRLYKIRVNFQMED